MSEEELLEALNELNNDWREDYLGQPDAVYQAGLDYGLIDPEDYDELDFD